MRESVVSFFGFFRRVVNVTAQNAEHAVHRSKHPTNQPHPLDDQGQQLVQPAQEVSRRGEAVFDQLPEAVEQANGIVGVGSALIFLLRV
jgi:hypothetical protein